MSPLYTLLLTVFLDMLGIGIMIPVIPQLLTNPATAGYLLPLGWSVEQGYILLGILTSLYPLFMFFSAPILGQLSDIHGRKPLLGISIFGTGLGHLLFGVGVLFANIPLLFISRIIDGITGGNIAIAQAAIADITAPKDRAKTFGLIGATFGIGFILGPFLGGILSSPDILPWFGPSTPFWFAGGLSFINTFLITRFFQETLKEKKSSQHFHVLQAFHNIKKAWSFSSLRTLYLTSFCFQSGFSFFTAFFSVYLIAKFGWTEQHIGNFFAYIGIWIIITQGFITRVLAKKYSEQSILKISLITFSCFTIILLIPSVWWQLLFIVPFFAIANGLTQANLGGLISRSGDARIQGELMGISSSINALAQTFPPIVSGLIASSIIVSAPIMIASALAFLSWIIFLTYKKGQLHE